MAPTIRMARPGEASKLAELVLLFSAEVLPDLRPHKPTIIATLDFLIANARGYVAVLEDEEICGFMAGMAAPSMWAPVLVAEEWIWWIAPRRRGRWAVPMIRHFEAWAADVYATASGLSHTGKSAALLFDRLGYRRVETKYLRML